MDGVFTAILIIGLILISTCMIIILIDRKNLCKNITLAMEKEKELQESIEDVEYIKEELIKLSDSIFRQIENKKNELDTQITNIALKIEQIEKKALELNIENNIININQDNGQSKIENKAAKPKFNEKYKEVAEYLEKGIDEVQIARILNINIGEVKLVSRFFQKSGIAN